MFSTAKAASMGGQEVNLNDTGHDFIWLSAIDVLRVSFHRWRRLTRVTRVWPESDQSATEDKSITTRVATFPFFAIRSHARKVDGWMEGLTKGWTETDGRTKDKRTINGRADQWAKGWTDEWTDEGQKGQLMDGWTNGQRVDGRMDGRTKERREDELMKGRTDGQVGGQTGKRRIVWTGGWTDGWTKLRETKRPTNE